MDFDAQSNQPANLRSLYRDESWSVSLNAAENCLVIQTTDYHAGPLKLPLGTIGLVCAQPAPVEPRGERKLELSVSRREKILQVSEAGNPRPLLTLSRRICRPYAS